MPRSNVEFVFCPAERWTQVEWYLGTIILNRRLSVGNDVTVRWRWFSAGFPPYFEGSFTGSAVITLLPSIYTSLEIYPFDDVNVRLGVA